MILLSRIENNKLSFCTIMCRNRTTSCNASHCSMQAPYSKLIFALRVCNSLYAVLLSLEGIQLFTTNVTPKIIQGPRTLLSFFKDFDTRPSLYKPEEPPTSTHRLWKTEVCSSYPFLGACYNRESRRRRIQEPFTSSVRSKDCHHYKKGRELGVVACF